LRKRCIERTETKKGKKKKNDMTDFRIIGISSFFYDIAQGKRIETTVSSRSNGMETNFTQN
jgi:hypothetical protein